MAGVLQFGEVLEAADQLSHDEQQELIDILRRRLTQASRDRLVAEVNESRQEFTDGRCLPVTPGELMREIMKWGECFCNRLRSWGLRDGR